MMTLVLVALWALSGPALPPSPADEAAVVAAAEALLEASFPEAAPSLAVRVVKTGGTWTPPLRLAFAVAPRGVPRAHTQTQVLVPGEDGSWRPAGWALLYVAHYDTVLVARRPLPRGTPVTPGDVAATWRETTTLTGEVLTPAAFAALAAHGPLEVARSMRPGRVLRAGDVRTPPAALPGSPVLLRYERAGFRLELACEARSQAAVGSLVHLRCDGRRYEARLTAPGHATWLETL